jgi:hypothetical protein
MYNILLGYLPFSSYTVLYCDLCNLDEKELSGTEKYKAMREEDRRKKECIFQ